MHEKLAEELRNAGYSVTKPRLTVFSALQSGKPRSMRELTLDLSSVIDRASIYRTVELFEKLGIVTRIKSGWKYKIELAGPFSPHHHHLTCTECGKVVSFEEPKGFVKTLETIAHIEGFEMHDHSLEISGVCEECREASLG